MRSNTDATKMDIRIVTVNEKKRKLRMADYFISVYKRSLLFVWILKLWNIAVLLFSSHMCPIVIFIWMVMVFAILPHRHHIHNAINNILFVIINSLSVNRRTKIFSFSFCSNAVKMTKNCVQSVDICSKIATNRANKKNLCAKEE